MEATQQRRYRVYGRVQGVFFRATTRDEARRLGLTGWVRNRADGSVEVLAQGRAAPLNELGTWLEEGPRAAHVESVEVHEESPTETFTDFSVRHG